MDPYADASLHDEMNSTAHARFWSRVDQDGPGGCWIWGGAPNDSGYGRFRLGGTGSIDAAVHRVSYRMMRGPLESWQQLHHECHTKLCVNPDHLTVTRAGEHNRVFHRKTECVNGHDLTDTKNVYVWRGDRHCRPCKRMRDRIALGIPHERWRIKDEY